MKKSLVLAMAMALGVTASAYAANPFSDVPAGHWAYDSIDKLAAAGVIDGMGDGTFQGGRNMTRYEMAQIVAKAMAKGANVDKLAAEFAEELDNLGVRVAALEKKADNVTITGQIRYDYMESHGSAKTRNNMNRLQTRLWVKGQINEDWTYTARLQDRQDFQNSAYEDQNLRLNQAWVGGRVGGLKVRAGRVPMNLVNGYFWDDTMEAVEASYGKGLALRVVAGNGVTDSFKNDKVVAAEIAAPIAGVKLAATYIHNDNDAGKVNQDVWGVTAAKKFGAVGFDAAYLKSCEQEGNGDKDGFVVGLTYKGANAAKPGSWGLGVKYYDQSALTYKAHTIMDGDVAALANGFKGMVYTANYALAKNILAIVEYNDMKTKSAAEDSYRSVFTRLQFSF